MAEEERSAATAAAVAWGVVVVRDRRLDLVGILLEGM